MADVGLDVEWRIIHGTDEFFNVTKAMHNGLQGDPRSLSAEERAIFARYNAANAAELAADDYDVVIVHDPQPVALVDHFPEHRAKWVWRGHIDFSTPNPDVFDVLLPSLQRYDAAVFHMREYAPSAPGLPDLYIWPPAIDPLAPKNMALSAEDAAYIVDQFGIDVERPLLTQVSRFDPWKDPLGVIDAYRLVKRDVPGVQLALVGSMAHDDPEGWDYYSRTVEHADGRPRHPHSQQHEQCRLRRGERVPGALGRVAAEVDQGRLRPDGDRGALEGDGRSSRAGSAASSRRSPTARPAGSSTRPRSARVRASRSSPIRPRLGALRSTARSTSAAPS